MLCVLLLAGMPRKALFGSSRARRGTPSSRRRDQGGFYGPFALLPVHCPAGTLPTRCFRSAPAAGADPVDAEVGHSQEDATWQRNHHPRDTRAPLPPVQTRLIGQWEQLRPQLRAWWDRLTEADLMQIGGQQERLISVVQQRYGYPRERAQQEVDRRLQEYSEQTAGVTATVTGAAQDVASHVAETARMTAAEAQERVRAAATAVTDTVAGARTALQDKGVQGLSGDLTDLIRRYPIPALLIGLGIGFVLARSLGTRQPDPGA